MSERGGYDTRSARMYKRLRQLLVSYVLVDTSQHSVMPLHNATSRQY